MVVRRRKRHNTAREVARTKKHPVKVLRITEVDTHPSVRNGEPRTAGRPRGHACEYVPSGETSCRCLRASRVRVTQNFLGILRSTTRCWSHYLRMENLLRDVQEGQGNIVEAEEL